mmetsp:Transcript_37928/g.67818  ORF Transcript_37928/g.67818 Transcript_37928/m.67818 type:complete len:128 (-) Transcript_37928:54-437(-)
MKNHLDVHYFHVPLDVILCLRRLPNHETRRHTCSLPLPAHLPLTSFSPQRAAACAGLAMHAARAPIPASVLCLVPLRRIESLRSSGPPNQTGINPGTLSTAHRTLIWAGVLGLQFNLDPTRLELHYI